MSSCPESAPESAAASLARRILAGEVRAAARLMRWLDDEEPVAIEALKLLYPHTGRAHVVGITGNPGSGKSTLTNRLIAHYRARGQRVGVVAVDPSSPFSGGAILGDRIRMMDHAVDPGVFIRSLATRGALGGLSRSTNSVVAVLDAMGYDVILVETVGVGQDEVDIIRTAHTSAVVVVPGLGDEIQAIKAGILEVADLFIVNKADREGSDRTILDLRSMHALAAEKPEWTPEIVCTVATKDEGVEEAIEAIARHRERLDHQGVLAERLRTREREVLLQMIQDQAMGRVRRSLEDSGELAQIVDRLVSRQADPFSVAEEILARYALPEA